LSSQDEETRANIVEAAQALLEEEDRAPAFAHGRRMSIDEAIAHALRATREALASSAGNAV
jgi:hypothetical protein